MKGFTAKRGRLVLVSALLPFAFAGVAVADEVTDWHEHMLAALATAGTSPTVSTREAALVSSAVFDAVNGIERRYEKIHVEPAAPSGASKRAAAVQAAYAVLLARFPAQAGSLGAKRAASLADIADGGQSLQRGVEWGQDVAAAILAWRSTDGFTPAPPPYLGGLGTGVWRPTPTAFQSGATPQLATMTPWVILSPSQFRPVGPPALNSAAYAADFNEVKTMGRSSSAFRTADQTDACLFWAGTSATFLWNRLALDLSADAGLSLSQNAHLLATVNVAMSDAIIACWDAKYHFVLWRPVTAIPLADTDGNADTAKDETWAPLIATPAHPEYVSGHSTSSSAGATVLADYFGEDTAFTLKSQANPSWVRTFTSFSDALDEVADARIFAGIHFRSACEDGVATGTSVAEYVIDNAMRRIRGKCE
jgi:hypothetical protein